METQVLLYLIAQVISDKKGFNVVAFESKNPSAINDGVLIAEGYVDRHLTSIAFAIQKELEKKEIYLLKKEESSQWVVLDYGQVMVHLFLPDARERYQLEKLWSNDKIIPLKIDNLSKDEEKYV